MSVGVSIPSKQDNFTLQASWAFNIACTHEKVDSLEKSGYGEPLSIDRTFIRPLVASLQLPDEHLQFLSSAPPVFFTSICHIFQLYLLILAFAFAAQPPLAISVKLCRNLVDESSTQIHFSLSTNSDTKLFDFDYIVSVLLPDFGKCSNGWIRIYDERNYFRYSE